MNKKPSYLFDSTFILQAIIIIAMAVFFYFAFESVCGKNAHADGEMCTYTFSEEEAKDILINAEKVQHWSKYIATLEDIIREQDKKIDLLQQAGDKLMKANEALEQANASLNQAIKIKDEQMVMKEKHYQEEIKKAKPGFFEKLGYGVVGAVVGSILTIVGLVAL